MHVPLYSAPRFCSLPAEEAISPTKHDVARTVPVPFTEVKFHWGRLKMFLIKTVWQAGRNP